MIWAVFYRKGRQLCGFSVSGHAGYADAGEDVICAYVTSAVEMTANGITEIAKVSADVKVEDNQVSVSLPEHSAESAYCLIESLRLHLSELSQQYPKFIQLKYTEV